MKTKLILIFTISLFFNFGSKGQGCNIIATYSNPIVYNGVSNITISGKRIMNPNGHAITLKNCTNIIIKDCILGYSLGNGVDIENCSNVTIMNCSFEKNQTGIYAQTSYSLKVTNNKFSNPQGPYPRGQFVQFNQVNGSGNEISDNIGESVLGFSNPEDLINVYQSNGTINSPILVKGNKFRGGGPRTSGGGILAGDGGNASFINVENNILVDPGQHGISVSSGTNIKLSGNQIFGKEQTFTNIGIYVWNQYEGTSCGNIMIENNLVNFTNGDCINHPANCHMPNPYWNHGNCSNVSDINNNWYANINESILPQRLLCPDLVVHYKFDDNTSEANGIYPLNGTQSGGLQYACGNSSSGNFDGVDDVVSLPLSDILKPSSSKFMFTSWILPTDFNKAMSVAHSQDGDGYNDGWRLIIINGGLYGRVVSDVWENGSYKKGDVASSGLILNQWNFVAFSYDGTIVKLYINGHLVSSAPLNGGIKYNLIPHYNNMRIGFSDGQNYFFKGRIDDVKFYRGVLTDVELMSEYVNTSVNFNSNATRPNVSITASPNLNVCKRSITLTALPAGATSYSWSSSSGNVGMGQSLTVSEVDTYTVIVNTLGCTGSNSVSTFSSGSGCRPMLRVSGKDVDENTVESLDSPNVTEVTVYPNPSRDLITIAVPKRVKNDTPILIYSVYGSIIHSDKLNKYEWKTVYDVSGIPDGLYLIRVFTEDLVNTTKLIVKH